MPPLERVSLSRLVDSITANNMTLSFTDTCGLFLCKKGRAEVCINDENVTIQAGDAVIYIPSTYVYVTSHSDDIEGIIYKASLDFALPVIETTVNIRNVLLLKERPYVALTSEQLIHMEQLVNMIDSRMEALSNMKTEETSLFLQHELNCLSEALIHEILFCYFSNLGFTPMTQDSKEQIIHIFMLSLLEHYKQERQVNFYAQQQCITPRYFSTLVKEKTGRTAQQWIFDFTINSIKKSLLYSQKSIKEIAIDYNFPTQSFFGKYFKQYTGLSPKQFREQMRRG